MAYLLAVILGLAFGAADQYLGSMSWLGPWVSTAAQVSAPWLILPFLLGATQRLPRRAALLGLIVTLSALLGYFAMTYSPMEVPMWTFHRFLTGLVAVTTRGYYNAVFIFAGIITGPVVGLLGQRWRVRRWWVSAAFVAGALCLEPVARWGSGQLFGPAPVWTVEAALGAIVATLMAYWLIERRRAPSAPSHHQPSR
ncbi:MAG: hypothetical protein QOI81_1677 [Actinomycetota bacterium]|jgi:hypothetical protein|nr:hypothetical protein [Actinomycetota bacterium]